MRFTAEYKEDIKLGDGTVVRLRLIRPDDKELLAAGFGELSPASRYRRFFTAKTHLSDAELRYLTEVDGIHHFAMGGLYRDAEGRQRGAGVARYFLVDEAAGVAEPAIAVVDALQGQGLGRVLFERMLQAAHERGVKRLRTHVLASNQPMRALVESLGSEVHSFVDGEGVLRLEVSLADTAPVADVSRRNPLYLLLVLAAQGLVVIRRALSRALGEGALAAEVVDRSDDGDGPGGDGTTG